MNTQISVLTPQQSKRRNAKIGHVLEGTVDDLFQRVAQADDRQAFETIFNKNYKSLCRLSGRMVQSMQMAEEIVDDVFYHFWKNRKNIRITSSFNSYLLVSVRNRSLDYLRRAKNQHTTTLDSVLEVPCTVSMACDHMAYQELNQHIAHAIQSLPDRCRLIFTMSRDQDLSYREIAEKLSLSIKTVDTQMGRALKHLRDMTKSWE
jgi:RNA polymerase sigma-70 factor (ECF subfamily)